jgi:hypothetical protein
MSPFLRELVTNKELIELDQDTFDNHPLKDLPAGFENIRAWEAKSAHMKGNGGIFVALFNLNDHPAELKFKWSQLGLSGVKGPEDVTITLPAHGSHVYRDLSLAGSHEK